MSGHYNAMNMSAEPIYIALNAPLIGAVFLVILPEVFRFLAEYRGVVYGLVIITVIFFIIMLKFRRFK